MSTSYETGWEYDEIHETWRPPPTQEFVVTNQWIDTAAVTTGNIADGAVTSAKIADGTVTQMDRTYELVAWTRVSMNSTNTTSTSYVDVAGWTDLPFTKQFTATQLFLTLHCGAYVTTPGSPVDFGIRINAVDVDVAHFFSNEGGTHRAFSAHTGGFGGLAAGNYAARLRWRSTSGTQINIDGNDLISLRIEELRW